MKTQNVISRRSFLGSMAAATALAAAMAKAKTIPVGLELYSVREQMKKDLMGTVQGVAEMGYKCVEFFASYYDWTLDDARKVRAKLDELHIQCYSTHNGLEPFSPAGIGKAIDINKILGARYLVNGNPGAVHTLDDWKRVAETLNKANETLKAHGMRAGYHNHDTEWIPVNGTKPMQVLADHLDKSIMLQLDVGTCLAAGSDPVAWIKQNPGRIRSMHLKDWSPQKEYKVLFGEGVGDWKGMFAAAESTGGVEYYLIEQEGSAYPEMETALMCLAAFHRIHG
jgi:sugar phosphate isomerase/epimerase